MSAISVFCWVLGAILIVAGYGRARARWRKYRYLELFQEHTGGHFEGSVTSRVAAELRRQAQIGGLIMLVGTILFLVGLMMR